MHEPLQFETPENVRVQYVPAGAGTRFVAWLTDQFLVFFVTFALFVVLLVVATSLGETLENKLEEAIDDYDETVFASVVIGIMLVIWGLGSFFYFALFELLMRGQTPGKRSMKIRVVKEDGFSVDGGSILLRNLFRIVDNIPILWVVPLLSRSGQRSGDMVAGTVVISDEKPEMSHVRGQLSERTPQDAEFRFDSKMLGRLSETDASTLERLLDRWGSLPKAQQESLAERTANSLAAKMQIDPPLEASRLKFLEDLLAATLRWQNRRLS